ncbi:uncharacterized protein ACO6RY_08661 [Pungitius sinensis]
MVQELELYYCGTVHELQGENANRSGPEQLGPTSRKRRLLRICIFTLGMLCIVQATLNVSLRLALFQKEDTDQFAFNSSIILDLCQNNQSQVRSSESCFCEKNLLRRLQREYQALEKAREILHAKVIQLTRQLEDSSDQGSGSGDSFLYEY